ncbi:MULTISPECIES: amidase [Rhodanobacter]|uniref:amidase n=1 Tax=Rhodanobacter TaxID=75309 RepID=UPI0004188AA0|nr:MULTISPECIES: amidase [Rhodanobacter]UJJ52060.1 amidase [Rhodanobacter denitrificans]UJM94805.1 amidase [Rhodanobacter denitrificans]UJM98335.1 amidase [Rhodanobacter denitrificans]UJN22252.1 amidase [Rhodanobacter denitrificans]
MKHSAVHLAAFVATLLAGSALAAEAATPETAYASIAQLQQRMDAGTLDSRQLTQALLDRIQRIDRSGPTLRAVIETNPEALALAGALDTNRTKAHGPLYGIPVLLKDNIDTGDRMLTTAGSLALIDAPAPRDAGLVERLRKAGALVLGKTNLSEWANFRSNHASSGWSGRGGQTKNPYVLDRNPCGSSAGSAAAVAAGLATLAIGSETDGSIICPAAMNGIVGIKPTLGLVSRSGIVPISHSQDTAGPMARSVADAAALLTVIAGSDPRDPATAEADRHATDYTKFLDPNGLRGKRIGVVRQLAGAEPNADHVLDASIALMKAQGAIIVDPVTLPHLAELGEPEMTVLLYDFKHDINAYLANRRDLKARTLADLIAFNQAHAGEEMPWFGQELFEQAEKKGPLSDKAYTDALAKAKRLSGPEGIDAALQAQHLDALLAPSWGPAFMTDPVLGDHIVSGDPTVGGASQPAAVAGYPSITVPAGFAHGLPVGIVLFGAKWSEPTLISIAYGFEQHAGAWQPPQFLETVGGKSVATGKRP